MIDNRAAITLLIEKRSGALERVTRLISRRGGDIASLEVRPLRDPGLWQARIEYTTLDSSPDRLLKHLDKLVNVVRCENTPIR